MLEFATQVQDNVCALLEDMDLTVLVKSFFFLKNIQIQRKKNCIFSLLGFDCPGDGTCSSQGICDDTIGSCVCNVGFEGNTCKGM